MKIAMMVRSYIPVPRPVDMIYAPIDLEMAIAKGLGARGHQVTIFAPLGSQVYGENVKIDSMKLRSLINTQADFEVMLKDTDALMNDFPGLWDRYMSNEMFNQANQGVYDILHFHHPETALSKAGDYPKVPVVYTLHDPIHSRYREVFDLYGTPNQHFVSISNNQRRDAPDLPYAATVYNGTDLDLFSYSDKAEDYLLYAGRIVPNKGVKEAIHVAKMTEKHLLIIGPVPNDPINQGYFEQYIKPELNDKILYLGHVDHDRLPTYFQKAAALLTPVQWEEPFGMTTIEAMSCGTPVISLNRGAAPEIIESGRTGFIANSLNDMVDAVGKIDTIKRIDCRKHIENNFSIQRMVDGYEKVFEELIAKKSKARRAVKLSKKRNIKQELSQLSEKIKKKTLRK